ncbi:CapA family protein [Patescibacteria group bacterium]|nr:CapA family protein [Patescibacteria group bacterium]
MNKKNISLLLLGSILVLLGVILFLRRSLPTSNRAIQPTVDQPATGSVTTRDRQTLSLSTSIVPSSTILDTSQALPATQTATSSQSDEVLLLVVGDIMLDRNVAGRTTKSGDTSYPFRQLPEGWLASADLTVGNLEGPVTPTRRPPEKSIDFQFDPSWLPILKDQGFDAFSQANNHALDQGAIGYADSMSRVRQAGFIAFGHQVNDGLVALATTTVKGERLAFLGWNNTDNPVDLTQAKQVITRAKAETDLVIAFLHWGTEYRDRPDAQNVEFAHWLIDQGVDVVIGGHPHWAQGFSTYKGKPIVWSLGNFIFDQDWSKETQQGLTIGLTITKDEIRIKPIPISIKLSQPKLEEGRVLSEHLANLAKVSDDELKAAVQEGKELVFLREKK